MTLKPLTPMPKISSEDGWDVLAYAAGHTKDGLLTSVTLWNDKIHDAQTILLDDMSACDTLAARFASLTGLDTGILSTMLVQLLPEVEEALREQEQEEPGHRTKQADQLVELVTQADVELFHYDDQGYASVPVATHKETWALRAKGFRRWLQRHF